MESFGWTECDQGDQKVLCSRNIKPRNLGYEHYFGKYLLLYTTDYYDRNILLSIPIVCHYADTSYIMVIGKEYLFFKYETRVIKAMFSILYGESPLKVEKTQSVSEMFNCLDGLLNEDFKLECNLTCLLWCCS